MELLPDFASVLRWFQVAGLLSPREGTALNRRWGESAVARRSVEAIRGLREKIRTAENGTEVASEIYFKPQKPEEPLCSTSARCRNATREYESRSRAEVRSMRAALCGHEQEGHAPVVQHAAVRKSS